jgi:hypothetical protein
MLGPAMLRPSGRAACRESAPASDRGRPYVLGLTLDPRFSHSSHLLVFDPQDITLLPTVIVITGFFIGLRLSWNHRIACEPMYNSDTDGP